MKINGNAIRPGNVIEHKGGLWVAVRSHATQPGKGGAYAQVELKNLRDGTKLNERFRSSENVERVRLDEKAYQFLFVDGDLFTFMDSETFDQITLLRDLIGEQSVFLQDGMVVTVMSYEDEPISVELPDAVTLEVVDTEAVIKGQTAAGSFKPAIVDNGERVMVPQHIEIGSRVVVSTIDGSYRERARD